MLIAQDSTSDTRALVALAVIAAGFVIGSAVASIVRRLASRPGSASGIRNSAGTLGTLGFSISLIVALVIALGVVSREALDQLSTSAVDFLPRALSAAIVLIIGNVVGAIGETATERTLSGVSPTIQRRVPVLVRWVAVGFSLIVAADQLGVDTTLITVAVASLLGSLGLAAALLTALGGRDVASQVAAGRALRHVADSGDLIDIGGTRYELTAVGSTMTELAHGTDRHLLPNAELLTSSFRVSRADTTDAS
ncbi:MAG: hypothetical protein ACR2P0_13260 [Acidimicrobiales bacterium]